MMRTKFTGAGAYCVTKDTLRDAYAVIEDMVGDHPTVTVEFEDRGGGTDEVSDTTLDAIRNSLITRTKPIKRLSIDASTSILADEKRNARFSIETPQSIFSTYDVVHFTAEGSADACSHLKNKIDDVVKAAETNFSWMWVYHNSPLALAPLAILLVVLLLMAWLGSSLEQLVLVGILGGAFAIGCPWLKSYAYPRVTFDIGHSKQLPAQAALRRKFFGGIIVTLIGAVIFWAIFR